MLNLKGLNYGRKNLHNNQVKNMKIYKFDKKKLDYRPLSGVEIVRPYIVSIIFVLLFYMIISALRTDIVSELSAEAHVVFSSGQSDFTQEKFIEELDKYNFRFPLIVQAQAIVESGNFESPIFKDNFNLFGMKQAVVRVNTAMGTNRNHAMYSDWRSSVMDRALYEQAYLRSIKNESEYLHFLGEYYAEDSNYVSKLNKIVQRLKNDRLARQ